MVPEHRMFYKPVWRCLPRLCVQLNSSVRKKKKRKKKKKKKSNTQDLGYKEANFACGQQ